MEILSTTGIECMKILVVDDSASTQIFTKKLLAASGYEVETVGNGAAALDMYAKITPDIVLLDITMPLMDGKETLRRILDLDKNAVVIMTTAIDDGEIIQGYLERGAVGYVVKPFGLNELITTIQNTTQLSKNKSSTTFFSLIQNKIESDVRKILDPMTSVVLKDVRVVNQERSPQMFSSRPTHQIRAVPQINQNSEFENIHDCIGYVTEFSGPRQGEVITLVRNDELQLLFENLKGSMLVKTDNTADVYDMVEFFNIINQKVITVLSNSIHLTLSREPIRVYDESKDSSSHWNDVIKATFEIKLNKSVTLDIILCTGRRYREYS